MAFTNFSVTLLCRSYLIFLNREMEVVHLLSSSGSIDNG